jgi:hypothetical protein
MHAEAPLQFVFDMGEIDFFRLPLDPLCIARLAAYLERLCVLPTYRYCSWIASISEEPSALGIGKTGFI